ncbi:cation diffusion facilitator family transporter [Clostridium felsineum]|uniref:cation diffusion facilitator family transporter n=1 Tax=Clostridium felsineum TaxID=36839 RepID=UPI00214D7A14|nr:cation diffusion facilitator family transporter [Clostridium felsineum]MCR3760673.1 cation diffusion facilitator family transporter [Clostridium felsineum]
MDNKVSIARLSIISNFVLIVLKLLVGFFTGSVSIISEAVHSTTDLVASIITFFSVKISGKPADEQHPYGHGKIENISGVIEAILIFIASALIIYQAVLKIIEPSKVEAVGIGFLVMVVSSIVNMLVSKKLYNVAEKEDSIALKADALHLKADVFTALGVGIGLLGIWITKIYFLDPIVAIIVAVFILKEAFHILKEAFNPLMDTKLSNEEISIIKKAISKHENLFCDFEKLKTRKAGATRYVDLTIVFPGDISVKHAHDICDILEEEITRSLKRTEVMIHSEACEKSCIGCKNSESK